MSQTLAEYNAEVDRQNLANGFTPEQADRITKTLIARAAEFEELNGGEEIWLKGKRID